MTFTYNTSDIMTTAWNMHETENNFAVCLSKAWKAAKVDALRKILEERGYKANYDRYQLFEPELNDRASDYDGYYFYTLEVDVNDEIDEDGCLPCYKVMYEAVRTNERRIPATYWEPAEYDCDFECGDFMDEEESEDYSYSVEYDEF